MPDAKWCFTAVCLVGFVAAPGLCRAQGREGAGEMVVVHAGMPNVSDPSRDGNGAKRIEPDDFRMQMRRANSVWKWGVSLLSSTWGLVRLEVTGLRVTPTLDWAGLRVSPTFTGGRWGAQLQTQF